MTTEQPHKWECGVEVTVHKKDGTREKSQIWGLTDTQAEEMKAHLENFSVEGVESLPHTVKVLYYYGYEMPSETA